MDSQTLVAAIEFGQARVVGTLDTIEKSGADVQKALAWRPGPGRAHIAWQAMHCAASLDKYVNTLRGQQPRAPQFISDFGGGSTPSDEKVPTLAAIREYLSASHKDFRDYVASLGSEDLARLVPGPGGSQRKLGDVIILLTWHEAHHQGQMHITWNMYKAAHGL